MELQTINGNAFIEVTSKQLAQLGKFTVSMDAGTFDLSMADVSTMLYLTDHDHLDVDNPVYVLAQHSQSYRELFAPVVVRGKPAISLSPFGAELLKYLFGSDAIRSYRNMLYPQPIPASQTRGR